MIVDHIDLLIFESSFFSPSTSPSTRVMMLRKVYDGWHKAFFQFLINKQHTLALHEACMRGQLEVCDTLLELGANPNLTDSEGRLPIQLLCSSDSVNISSVQKFLKIGTNVPLESSDIDSNLDIVTCKTSRQTRTIARVERT